jgi:thiamine transport system substrate-binding protein
MQAMAASVGEVFPPISTEEATPTGEKTKKAFDAFWKDLRSQWVTLAPGWSQAYGMFLKGEAPLVWSYVTSEAYHRTKWSEGERDRYRAVLFEDGNPVQIEGAGILKDAPGGALMRKRSLEFLELLVSEEIQKKVPETQWMMPTRLGVKLPMAFQVLPTAKKRFSPDVPREKLDETIERWRQATRD